jgi:PAS domain S-box-containing protein
MESTAKIPPNWFEHIVKLANEGIWTLGADGLTNYINERGASILGYSPEELLGRRPEDFLFSEERQAVAGDPGLNGRVERVRVEVRACRRDGSAVWLSLSTSPIIGDDGSYQGAMAVFSDITERKLAERSLAFQSHLLASVHDAILATDKSFIITYWNAMAERLFGWTAEEAIGQSARKTLNPKIPGISPEAAVEMAKREGYFDGEAICHRKDGTDVYIDVHATMVRDETGRAREYVGSLRDISDRKRAEEALRKSEELYRHLIQYAPTAIFEMDFLNMRLTKVNDVMSEMTGYSQEELLSMNPFDFMDDEGKERLRQGIAERLSGGRKNEPAEYKVRVKGGREMWAVFSLKPIYQNGKVTGALVIGHDDTERRAVREALYKSEERLRTIIENSRDGIYMFDLRLGRFIFMSPAQVELTGFTPEEASGLTSEEVASRIHPDDRLIAKEYQERVITGKDAGEPVEYRWRTKSGEYRWLSDRRKLVGDETGRPMALVGITRDITERKREEETLRKSEERLKQALSAGHMGIWDWNMETDEAVWNDEQYRMLGYRVGEVRPTFKAWVTRIHPQDKVWMQARLDLVLKLGGDLSAEFRVLWPDGTVHWIYALGGLERDERGNAIRTYGVMMDITDRKNVEKELARYAGELERSNAELEQFAYVASHDLQEPLRMVTIYMDLLSKKYESELGPQAKEYIGIAKDGAERMRQLINDLLEYSRIDTRRREFLPVDMGHVAAEVTEDLSIAIGEAGAEVIIGDLPTVMADEVQMKQVLTNLVSNAIKFRSGSRLIVDISVRDGDSEWLFSVQDNGIGIDPRYQDKLFQMFSRLHSRDQYPGTGIGLAIAKKIVERHGGKMWVESDGKHGTTFFFTIPRSGVKAG